MSGKAKPAAKGAKKQRKGRATTPKTQNKWRGPFLAALARSGVVSYACKRAKITRTRVYGARQDDPLFAEQWDEAELIAKENLEAEAQRRALTMSDTLLIFLLKARDPVKYGDRHRFEFTGPNGGPIEVSTPKQRANALADLISKAASADNGDSDG